MPDVVPTVNGLVERVADLARRLHQLDAELDTTTIAALDERIASAEQRAVDDRRAAPARAAPAHPRLARARRASARDARPSARERRPHPRQSPARSRQAARVRARRRARRRDERDAGSARAGARDRRGARGRRRGEAALKRRCGDAGMRMRNGCVIPSERSESRDLHLGSEPGTRLALASNHGVHDPLHAAWRSRLGGGDHRAGVRRRACDDGRRAAPRR